MSNSSDNYYLRTGSAATPSLFGLEYFKNTLEREYFSEVSVQELPGAPDSSDLVLGLHTRLDLENLVEGYRIGLWDSDPAEEAVSPLLIALEQLNLRNPVDVDIDELTFYLQDTLVVIKSIYPRSIAEQLGPILKALSVHYDYLLGLKDQLPYEIFIPVFEEEENGSEMPIVRPESFHRSSKDYLSFWGLYYADEKDALIYDLSNHTTISGELYMLNQ